MVGGLEEALFARLGNMSRYAKMAEAVKACILGFVKCILFQERQHLI